MKVGIVGFGHFASIVAVCLAERGHTIYRYDEEPYLLREDQRPAHEEPGFAAALAAAAPNTWLTNDLGSPTKDVIWIAYDVPLTKDGHGDSTEIKARIIRLHEAVSFDIPFLVSCQWPVGTSRQLATILGSRRPFYYVMENVRAGKALADFRQQNDTALGVRDPEDASTARPVGIQSPLALVRDLLPGTPLLIMSWESAELAKHTTNAFMALQIAFINEISRLCTVAGADAADVSRVLCSDNRVSPNAPLKPGGRFGGGSLKRDLLTLQDLSLAKNVNAPILHAILWSNEQ